MFVQINYTLNGFEFVTIHFQTKRQNKFQIQINYFNKNLLNPQVRKHF